MFPLSLLPDMRWGTTSQLLVLSQLLPQPRPGDTVCVSPRLHFMRAGPFGQEQLKVCPLHSVCAVLNHLRLVPVPQLIAVPSGKFHRSLVLVGGAGWNP